VTERQKADDHGYGEFSLGGNHMLHLWNQAPLLHLVQKMAEVVIFV
jgi:hypothetical protein